MIVHSVIVHFVIVHFVRVLKTQDAKTKEAITVFKMEGYNVKGLERCSSMPHEARHAVVAHLLGFTGVWIDMEDGPYRAIVRHDYLPVLLAVTDASSSAALAGGRSGGGGSGGSVAALRATSTRT